MSKHLSRYGTYLVLLLFLAAVACRSKSSDNLNVGNFVFAQMAEITPGNIDQISSISFIVHTKPGNMSR